MMSVKNTKVLDLFQAGLDRIETYLKNNQTSSVEKLYLSDNKLLTILIANSLIFKTRRFFRRTAGSS